MIGKVSKNGVGYDFYKKYIMSENNKIRKIWIYLTRTIGHFIILAFYIFLILSLNTYFFTLCKIYYLVNRDLYQILILITIGFAISYNMVFNYTLCVFISPGNTIKLKNDKENSISEKKLENSKICRKCEFYKPERAHHCSICETCILKKDHHNIFVNNCVGHFNQRYFILVNFYFLLFALLECGLYFHSKYDERFKKYNSEKSFGFGFTMITNILLIFILLPVNIWQWYLVWRKQTTIEFLNKILDEYNNENIRLSYQVNSLQIVFGTNSFFCSLLPSTRKLPLDGIIWNPQIFSAKYLNLDKNDASDNSLGIIGV